jgi:hypothetical protein
MHTTVDCIFCLKTPTLSSTSAVFILVIVICNNRNLKMARCRRSLLHKSFVSFKLVLN